MRHLVSLCLVLFLTHTLRVDSSRQSWGESQKDGRGTYTSPHSYSAAPSIPLSSISTLFGTGGIGFEVGGLGPGPQFPFGPMRLTPDTAEGQVWIPFQHFGGYNYLDTHIRAFTHTHTVGAGLGDFGNFGLMAVSQTLVELRRSNVIGTDSAWYRSKFSHDNEIAQPGLYEVYLEDPAVYVRLTAIGTLAGLHEYTYLGQQSDSVSDSVTSALVLDICTQLSANKHPCTYGAVSIDLNDPAAIVLRGHTLTSGGLTSRSSNNGGVDVYFHARIIATSTAAPIQVQQTALWIDKKIVTGMMEANTTSGSLGVYLDFGPNTKNDNFTISVYVGISFINNTMAELNLEQQLSEVPISRSSSISDGQLPTFDEILANTLSIWSDKLGLIEVFTNATNGPSSTVTQDIDELNTDVDTADRDGSPLYNFTTYGLSDRFCSGPPTGFVVFPSSTCVITPTSVQPMYRSLKMYGVDLDRSGNYSLEIYNESPACDDFVGWFTNGTLGDTPSECQQTNYFSFRITLAKTKTRTKSTSNEATRPESSNSVPTSISSDFTVEQFYALLYHTFLAPTAYTETGGLYLGFDNVVHTWSYPPHSDGSPSHYYSDMSLWDTHRTQNPLIGLLLPQVATDIVRSLYTMYTEGGDLPRWPLANVYTNCMSGNHGLVSITDWIVNGVVDLSTLGIPSENILTMALHMIDTTRKNGGRVDIGNYTTIGYVPVESDSKGAALTLEYSYDDWAVGVLAEYLGDTDNAERLLKRSENYKNVWSIEDAFMCPRSVNGSFQCPSQLASLLPYPIETGYTEADARQEMWFVPHDPTGLIQLFDSTDAFVEKLSTFIENGFNWIFPHEEIPNNYYWSGNEPDIFAPYLFNWANHPERTQNYTRQLLKVRYGKTPELGLPGNDDYGTM